MQKLIFLLVFFVVSIKAICQAPENKTYPIYLERAPLGKIKQVIRNLTGYSFADTIPYDAFYTSIHCTGTLHQILDTLFHPYHLKWQIAGNLIGLAPQRPDIELFVVTGQVTDVNDAPIRGATIGIKTSPNYTLSGYDGRFAFLIEANTQLTITADGYKEQQTKKIRSKTFLSIKLEQNITSLTEVQVILEQEERKKDSASFNSLLNYTASKVTLRDSTLNRNPDNDLYKRISGNASGFLINKNIIPNTNQSSVSIRNRATINAQSEPLIVLDDMVYSGHLSDLNPDDVESITILKDAAATSKWGIFSGNGIIVVATKRSEFMKKLQINATATVNMGNYDNLFYLPRLSAPGLIDLQKNFYNNGVYNNTLANSTYIATNPVAEILDQQTRGIISANEAQKKLDTLSQVDVRQQAKQYLLRRPLNQHFHLGLSGGSPTNKYYFSLSYDRNLLSLAGDDYDRITGTLNNTIVIDKKRSEAYFGVYLNHSLFNNNGISYTNVQNIYEGLKDANGNNLEQIQALRKSYTDTAGYGHLLNWKYRLLDEQALANDRIKNNLLMATAGINYNIINGLQAVLLYRLEMSNYNDENNHSADSYFTRDLVNTYTQPGSFQQRIPPGSIIDGYTNNLVGNTGKAQLNYSHTTDNGVLAAYAAMELRQVKTQSQMVRTYGDNGTGRGGAIDFVNPGPLYYNPGANQKVPYINDNTDTLEKFASWHGGIAYTYKNRYAASATIRKDESNIFGVKANQKGVPFFATGVSWDVITEDSHTQSIFSWVRLRASHGYCGNVNKLVSSQATLSSLGNNPFGAPVSGINNPPNPDLRWERIRISNLGVDFTAFKKRLSGTVEYYIKNATDVIAPAAIDPTTGMTTFTGNVASMKGHGMDVTLNTNFIFTRKFNWQTTFLLSHAVDKTTNYTVVQPTITGYFSGGTLNPLQGNPLYSVYALRYMGLDDKGNPVGFMDNHPTTDYATLMSSPDLRNMVYMGPSNPTWFGTLRNSFRYGNVDFSFTINWKAGYYFRRSSINYSNVLNGSASYGHPDYEKRWQQPGDENKTRVPSLVFPLNYERDFLYTYSTDLVERADHVRLQDVRIGYHSAWSHSKKAVKPSLEIFLIGNNLGLLWKANHQGIDPDFVNTIPDPRSLMIGIRTNF